MESSWLLVEEVRWDDFRQQCRQLLVHCGKTLSSTETHLVLLFGFSGIRVRFPGDAKPHRHPCNRFVAESVERVIEYLVYVLG